MSELWGSTRMHDGEVSVLLKGTSVTPVLSKGQNYNLKTVFKFEVIKLPWQADFVTYSSICQANLLLLKQFDFWHML